MLKAQKVPGRLDGFVQDEIAQTFASHWLARKMNLLIRESGKSLRGDVSIACVPTVGVQYLP